MAPIGLGSITASFTSPEVAIVSLIVFLVLNIVLVALCANCKRNSGNAYDVSGATTDGAGGPNGTVGTKSGGPINPGAVSWRSHTDMPPSTLERTRTVTN